MDDKNIPLATEVITTLKRIIILLIIAELLTIGGFLWYISLPVEEVSYEQSTEDINNSDVRQNIGGGIFGEGETESNIQAQSDAQ